MSSDPLARVAELPGVPESVAESRDAVDRLLRHRVLRGPRPATLRLAAESALRSARASAALDGEDIPLERLRGERAAPSDAPVLQGALRVGGALATLAGAWHRAPRQVLARMHALAAAGLADPARLGRPAPTAAPGIEPGGTVAGAEPGGGAAGAEPGGGAAGAEPGGAVAGAEPDEVAARLDLLAELLTSGANPPALVIAAVVHGELLALRPFGVADAVVARAAQRLTLMTCGLDPKGLTVPEVGHLELGAGYPAALSGYQSGTADGVAGWIRHCCTAVSLGARESLAVCEAWQRGAA